MNNVAVKRSATLLCGALLAAVMGGAETAFADVQEGDLIFVEGTGDGPFATTWGSAYEGLYVFGSTTTYTDPLFSPATVDVSSGSLPGEELGGFFSVDFGNFAPGDFPNLTFRADLKEDGTITEVIQTGGPGTWSTDGNSIFWEGLGADVAASPVISMEFIQIPAPGAMGLLVVAFGAAGCRRRRRC